ncbi:MAG: hypothetical protein Q9191_005323 [Dirinaria sp. TL-2023a]
MAEAPECPLTEVAEALRPFIKTRQEALRIRRILSLYLASTVQGSTPDGLPFDLPVSSSSEMRVNEIPSRITGLRRDYLLALQANIRARNEYDAISESISESSNALNAGKSRQINGEASSATTTYLGLLQAQRKHEKLSIVNDYIDELGKKESAKLDYLTLASVQKTIQPVPDLPFTMEDNVFTALTDNSNIENLTARLERTLLSANAALERERRLLAQTKSQFQADVASGASNDTNPCAKIHALTRTRNELIAWTEDRLAKIDEQDDDVEDLDPTDNYIGIEQQKENTTRLYKDYLDARRRLIELTTEKRSVHQIPDPVVQKPKASKPIQETTLHSSAEASKILPCVTEHLIPAADAQKAMHQQKAHILNSLTVQKKITADMLDKLADESHLLANYPIPTEQPSLRTNIPSLGGPKLSPSSLGGIPSYDGESSILAKGRMWASAADSARIANNATLSEHLEHGEKHARAAETSLDELRKLLNGGVEHQGDIWTEEDRHNPWTGLSGRIGIIERKN